MVGIALIILSLIPITRGKIFIGNKIGGTFMLLASIATQFMPQKLVLVDVFFILVALGIVYFFCKDLEPSDTEGKTILFNSSKKESRTYGRAEKGLTILLITSYQYFVQ